LAKVIIFDPSVQVFPGFLTTSAIFLFEQGWAGDVEMFTANDVSALDEIESHLYTSQQGVTVQPKSYTYNQLDPHVKWRHYYGDLKINLHLQQRVHLTPLHTFANVRRGIATGANPFFTLSDANRKRHNIGMEYLTPCLTRASHVQYHIFGEQEFAELAEGGKNVFLLNLTGKTLDASVRDYIRWGEEEGFQTGYLTRNRQPWYSMEPLLPADLWVKTFSRNRVVFIENHTSALHLTCFHGIYLNSLGQQYRKAIFLYLITDLAREIFEGQKREYSAGLGKFEPNDIRNAYVLDLRHLSASDLSVVERLYEQYLQVYHLTDDGSAGLRAEAESVFAKYW
jgi:adenine-specific DNA-methyltransferase